MLAAALAVGMLFASGVPGVPRGVGAQEVRLPLPDGRGEVVAPLADSGLAQGVVREITARPGLPGLPPGIPTGVTIHLAAGDSAFAALSGGRPPEWSAGVAIPSQGLIVLPTGAGRSTPDLLGRTLRHEWAHLGLHQYLDPLRVPRWFSEGYAQWASGWDRASAWRLRLLVALGRTPPLDSLTLRFPDDRTSAEAAYLLSATMVEYLVDASGEEALGIFLARWRDEGRFEVALARTYGLTPSRLETAWRKWLKDRYGWIWLISNSGLGWAMLALLVFLLFRIRRRRDREKMARLRADELPAAPAWWMGEPEGGPLPPPGAWDEDSPSFPERTVPPSPDPGVDPGPYLDPDTPPKKGGDPR